MSLHTERVAPDAWDTIDDWDDAVAASARPSVFLTRAWQTAWWRCFGQGLEPLLLRAYDDRGRTVGLAPLYLQPVAPLSRVPVRRLGVIGDRVVGSEYLGLVARAGHESEVAAAVTAGMPEGCWHVAELVGLVDGDPAAGALVDALRAGAAKVRRDVHPCSAVRLPADPDAYFSGLGRGFGRSMRQRVRRWERSPASLEYFRTTRHEDVAAHLERFFALHQAHWTAVGYSGVFHDRRMREFYREVTPRLLDAGLLHFWHLEVDGVVRACQYAFAYRGVLHSLQEAYDTQLRAPGLGGLGVVLRAHVLRTAIEEGLHTYDFLGGDEDFKLRWGTARHVVTTVQLQAPGAAGQLAWWAEFGSRRARARLVGVAPSSLVAALRVARGRRAAARSAGGVREPSGRQRA